MIEISRPGITHIHQAKCSQVLASCSMEPQEAAGGGTPRPKKLSEDSSRMALGIPMVAFTITGAMAFGIKCLVTIRRPGTPTARAAVMKSVAFSRKNSLRSRRDTPIQPNTPITTITLKILGLNNELTEMIR